MSTSCQTPSSARLTTIPLRTREAIETEIQRRIEAERARIEAAVRSHEPRSHFQRPAERPFTADERDRVTILFGGLTSKHEWLIRSAFQSAGYKVEVLPTPDVASFQLGKEYGNNGQCNPTYFTVGHLIKYLQQLESSGIPRQHIIDNYVFFTAGSCGPCRFGMYEAEYRLAVQNAGFDGFRVLLFQQTDGIKAASGEPGLKFTVDFGMSAFSALNYGDILNDMTYQIRPFEAHAGETDRVMAGVMEDLTATVRERQKYEIEEHAPAWLLRQLHRKKAVRDTFNVLGKIYDHLYGPQTIKAMGMASERIGAIDVDRLRVKPIVKVTGEFWAQTTEGDGNFRMFSFLEREGAQVMVEPIGTWIMYMLWLAKAQKIHRKDIDHPAPKWSDVRGWLMRELQFRGKVAGFAFGDWFWNHQYRRAIDRLGGIAHPLVKLDQLAGHAAPYYNVFARGGEGHMEVAKNIYYTVNKKAHMVLSLKPFGCMPSSQSDGVQSAVMNHFKDMIFLPIETSGEGEINAHSRVQMALGEAKAKARLEFRQALESTGKSLDDIRRYIDGHPILRRPFYQVPHVHGMTGTAAQFVLHVSDLMDGRARLKRLPGLPRAAAALCRLHPPPRRRDIVSASNYLIGLDVGSTTVKAVAVDEATDQIVWSDYQRHETKQPEKTLEFLQRMETELSLDHENCRIFMTGSGGGALAPLVGGKFVQEVTAVSLAVEKLHPEVNSVVELGGQDAKIIVFKEDPESRRKKKIPSMNDKCAGGTGAVIDKINAKLRIPVDQLGNQGYLGIKLHKVAGKCGVFAETDINGLQKEGTPSDELMASLFDAIVLQNLTVLTRGHTLRPHVLLLGGPNTFIRGMREAWQHNIPKTWKERGVEIADGQTPESLIKVPANAQYFAALGAVQFGRDEETHVGRYGGTASLEHYITSGRDAEKAASGGRGLSASEGELGAFRDAYRPKPFVPATFQRGELVRGFVGVDGGSTSTKAVLLSTDGDVLCKVYQLSKGNPIQDTIDMFDGLRAQVEQAGATLEVLGVGTTGYAKDILKDVLEADAALVETVAHTESAVRFYNDPHVIVDVGGQDIKLIVLRDGRVKDFKLNTQCSAGNGYFLQSTAEGFGIGVRDFADKAFAAESMPLFGYGCAVFMQSDIVNFQRQGWAPEEILAGLAAVLPKNIFLYVASIPNLAKLGTRFILQGGTQHNLAAVKAEVDFIRSNFRGADAEPEIIVHEHCGESGAIGAGVEAMRLFNRGHRTTFIGLDAVRKISYRTTRNEATRCNFCKNNCLRTFIDIKMPDGPSGGPADQRDVRRVRLPPSHNASAGHHSLGEGGQPDEPVHVAPVKFVSKVAKADDERRLIIATCEKGSVEDVNAMRDIKSGIDEMKKANPNFVEMAAKEPFRPRGVQSVADPVPQRLWTRTMRERAALIQRRSALRIGIPRVLNMYTYAPFFNAYFESLGVLGGNVVYSDYTSGELYREGAGRGAIDPCFPAKIAVAHVHNLLFAKHAKKRLDYIFFPMVDVLHTSLMHLQGSNACPTVTVTPETAKAAFIKEGDVFAQQGVRYLCPMINFADRPLLCKQLLEAWGPLLGLSSEENLRAVDVAFRELLAYEADVQRRARQVLDQLEREKRVGIVVLARPYHHDPGLNHEILEEFQKLGYPVFSQSTLPTDPDLLERLFGDEVRTGTIRDPLEIQDVWKNSYSANTNQKVWAAKFTARHPNLVALELSSFKCGHDAPIYSVVEGIIEKSGTPYFSFKDIDENKPSGSIRIRVETIHYFLKRYVEDMQKRPVSAADVDRHLAEYERRLREELLQEAELARLAEQQQALAHEMKLSRRLLPVVNVAGASATTNVSA